MTTTRTVAGKQPTSLLLRMSDEKSWACEPFLASAVADLREGCLEAFATQRADWTCAGNRAIPAHQSIKRDRHETLWPRTLVVQVCYHGEWCSQPFTPVIHEPGSVVGAGKAWRDEDWSDAWQRCCPTWAHADELGKLLHLVSRR